ncbi:hypothetical protein GQ53DRAFT_740703 [Thozetella sp. PMI_491]|nr:hypothetical protein GQ53DRAFT_740703 [Thozetella sp. PMI_491]
MGVALSRLWASLFRRRLGPAAFAYARPVDGHNIRLLQFVRPPWYTFRLARPQLLISTHPLDKVPKYLALSYTWGPPQDTIFAYRDEDKLPLLLNDRHFSVFPNLMDAFYGLQRIWDFDDDVQHLWVDAICINQTDLVERSAQVDIMDQIFIGATTTAVWLGKTTPETAIAMRMCKAIQQIPPRDFAPYFQQYPNVTPPPDAFWQLHGLPPLDDERQWAPLIRMFENRWFSRAWVIQEVTLAAKVIVLCGNWANSWDELGYVALAGRIAKLSQLEGLSCMSRYLAGETEPAEAQDWVVYDPWVNLFQLWWNRHRYLQRMQGTADDTLCDEMRALSGCGTPTAASWLMYFALMNRWADASDLRDKVFGHLGLVRDIAKRDGIAPPAIHAVYFPEVAAPQVYEQAMRLLIEDTDNLSVLMAVNDPPGLRPCSLPSWVPDLSRRQGLDLMWSIRPHFKAYGKGDSISSEVSQGSPEKRKVWITEQILHARGACLGTVKRLSVSLSDLMGFDWYLWVGHLLELEPIYSFTRESRVEAFWKTLLMNSMARKFPVESEHGEMFRAYVLQCMARFFPGAAGTSGKGSEHFQSIMDDVNQLASTDTSGHIPCCQGPTNIMAQIAGVSEDDLPSLSGEAIIAALSSCVDKMSALLIGMDGSLVNRRIAFSDQGHMVNLPMWAETGDKILVLDSCPCPLALRQYPDEAGCYTLVGPAYVHGVMYGEAIGADTVWEEIRIR